MYDNAPKWLRQPLSVDNKQSLEFTNNSFVKASSANANAGVSQALSLLVFDEAAVLEQRLAAEIWSSASPTLSTGGDCVEFNTEITVKNKGTGQIKNVKIGDLYNEL